MSFEFGPVHMCLLIRRDAIPASKLEACGGEDFSAGEAEAEAKER